MKDVLPKPPTGSRYVYLYTYTDTYTLMRQSRNLALQKPPVAGLVTMGRLQLSKEEDRDRDPEGTRTCHRLVHVT